MYFRFILFAILVLIFAPSSESRKLQKRDGDDLLPPVHIPHGTLLFVENPPRTFILGVLLVVALNIRNKTSNRLSSVVSQELLNWEIDALTAYSTILNEYSTVEVTEELAQVTNKTYLQIEDLQILINASTCSQSSSNLTVDQVVSVIFRLENLYREGSNITLNLGCGPQNNNGTTTITDDGTESTTVSSDTSNSTQSERKHHGIVRHGQLLHHDNYVRQSGNSRNHLVKHIHESARDHQSKTRERHLQVHNEFKQQHPGFKYEGLHHHHKERSAHETN